MLVKRTILTEADSANKIEDLQSKLNEKFDIPKEITEEEKENWPKFRDFTLANFKKSKKVNMGIIEYLEKKSEKTRSMFDKLFEKITGKRIDNAGNWIVTLSLLWAGSMILRMYRDANDKLRLQLDDILTYRDTLEMEVTQLKQECDNTKEKLIEKGIKF